MPRRISWTGGLVAVWVFVSSLLSFIPSTNAIGVIELVDGTDVMQCVTECVGYEGRSALQTCKWRCANIHKQLQQSYDCMSVYKRCLKICSANKGCKRVCKDELMNCS